MLHFVKQRDRFYVSFMYSPDHQLSIFGPMKNIHINFVEVILSVKQWDHMIDIILESSYLPTNLVGRTIEVLLRTLSVLS